MKKGDQLCILRAEVKTTADALNLLRLVGALTAIGVPLDDDCPYLETRELVESRERRLVTWTLRVGWASSPAVPGILPGTSRVNTGCHAKRRSCVFRRMRNTAGGTPTLPRARRAHPQRPAVRTRAFRCDGGTPPGTPHRPRKMTADDTCVSICELAGGETGGESGHGGGPGSLDKEPAP